MEKNNERLIQHRRETTNIITWISLYHNEHQEIEQININVLQNMNVIKKYVCLPI